MKKGKPSTNDLPEVILGVDLLFLKNALELPGCYLDEVEDGAIGMQDVQICSGSRSMA